VGDYVLVHVGFALSVLDEEEAASTLQFLESMGEMETFGEPAPARVLAGEELP
jgi:hydrogenase expression/formation protein HypC